MAASTLARPRLGSREAQAPSRSAAGVLLRLAVYAVLIVAAVGIAYSDRDYASNLTLAPVYAVVGLGLNVLVGYTGQLSLGQWAFVGLGAMTAANVAGSGTSQSEPVHFAVAFLAAVAVGALVALFLGAIALRITGLYLALVTLIFGVIVGDVVLAAPGLNGNAAGVKANRPGFLLTPFRYYLFCIAILVVIFLLDRQLSASKAGRAMLAVKDNERVAQAFGVNVVSLKLLSFAIAGGTAGLAGAMAVFSSQTFSQQNYVANAYTSHTLLFVVMVVVGGLGRRGGVVLASIFFSLVDIITSYVFNKFGLSDFYQANAAYLPGLIGGVLLLQTVIQNPGGLGGLVAPIGRWLAGGTFELHHGGGGGVAAVDGSATRA